MKLIRFLEMMMNHLKSYSFKLGWVLAIVFWTGGAQAHSGLILQLTGDNTATDASGNGHHGTLQGDTSYGPGMLGSAFSFDGSGDYVSIANDPVLEPISALSVTAWVSMGPIAGQVLIVDSSHGFVDLKGWFLQTWHSGEIGFGFANGVSAPEVRSTTEIDDAVFHHTAGVFDGTTLSIYVDGNLENQIAYSGTPLPSGRELRIGASWGGGTTTREVTGLIDDVRIYNHALTAAEVRALVTAVPEPTGCGLLCVAATALSFRRGARGRLIRP